MMYADNEDEAKAILFLIGLVAIALILFGIIYLIYRLIDWLKWRKANEKIHKN